MRKAFIFLLLANSSWLAAFSQYWQQRVNYTINVSLNDREHTLDGFETIEYYNNSPDTLKFIWFHIWPNAYKNDQTAFSDQLLENGNTKFYFSDREAKGYINRLDFKVENVTALTEDHPEHIDIIKLILPSPLPPGKKISITTPFHVKLPYNFSRSGHEGQSYQVTQWYPKPAVYDKKGWHPMTYLDQGEFYSEFGNFEVNITVPENYVVAATGELQNDEERKWLLAKADSTKKNLVQSLVRKTQEGKLVVNEFPPSSPQIKILKYRQENIHDFAWFADKRYVVNHDTLLLASGRKIDVFAFYINSDYKAWQMAVESAKKAIHHYSDFVGEYPYNVVSVAEGPESFGGGMEYPTITVISPTADVKQLEATIVHEVGHNWFYGILGTNEREHPWMDEGINTYYDDKFQSLKDSNYFNIERLAFESKVATKKDQPSSLPSEKFTALNYGLSVYYKTAEWLKYLESQIGTETFNKAMQTYYSRWKFKHPQPEDFKAIFEEAAGKSLQQEFSYLHKTGSLPTLERKGFKFYNIIVLPETFRRPKSFPKETITAGPIFGMNSYDKLMIGAFVTNLKIPRTPFNYLLIPMYGTGSKKINFLGFSSYTIYPEKLFSSIDLGISASRFSMRKYVDDQGKKNFLGFSKIVPGIKLTLREKDLRSERTRFVQFRSYLINEQALRFFRDTVITGPDTVITDRYNIVKESRNLHQLRFVIMNHRALYPYWGELKAEAGKYFARLGFTGNYFFNYKEGGLNLRLFAGKFFYTSSRTFSKQFATMRYHLNLSGPDGSEDYTFSDYFAGRSHFEGWQSQQLMIRDGAFKVSTPLLANKVGRTDDWLAAVNLTSTIPAAINPFMLLPVKLPVKLFFDIGTYAGAWEEEADTDRFLYDAGIYLPLLKETVKIYVPLFYSKVYGDYYKSTIPDNKRFWKKISFSIDISNLGFNKLGRNISF